MATLTSIESKNQMLSPVSEPYLPGEMLLNEIDRKKKISGGVFDNEKYLSLEETKIEVIKKSAGLKMSPPKLSDEKPVDEAVAREAYKKLMAKIGTQLSNEDKENLLNNVVDMKNMTLLTILATMNGLSEVAKLKMECQRVFNDGVEKADKVRIKEQEEQSKKAIEDAEKAKKASIFTAIVEWIMSIVQVIVGVIKIIGAVLSGGGYASGFVSGVADIAAGICGIGKAICSTLALVDPDNAKKYEEVGEKLGIAQTTLEVTSAVVDMLGVGYGMFAARAAMKAAKTALSGPAGAGIRAAVKTGADVGSDAVKNAISKFAKTIADDVAEQFLTKTKSALKAGISEGLEQSVKGGFKETAKNILKRELTAEWMKNLFTKGVLQKNIEQSISKGLGKLAKEGITEITDEAIDKAIKDSLKHITKTAFSTAAREATPTLIMTGARASLNTSQKINSSVIGLERAQLKKEIEQLGVNMNFLSMIINQLNSENSTGQKDVKELSNKASASLKAGTESLSAYYATLTDVALHIA